MNLIITNMLPFHLKENRTNLVSSSDDTLFPLVLERLEPVGRGLATEGEIRWSWVRGSIFFIQSTIPVDTPKY